VTRSFFPALALAAGLSLGLHAQQPSAAPPPDKPANSGAQAEPQYAEPEEEDASEKPRTYDFNPIEAEKDVKAGKFYLKKGTASGLKAALNRFDEATKFNPQLAEAYALLGETREKLKDKKGAKAAYEKYLELAPSAKDAGEIRKRLARLG
jgi:tetratricopeptide (TPR) repeat protein